MATVKSLAGKNAFRIPYIYAAIFKMYSSNTAEKVAQTKAQYLSTLEAPMEKPPRFRADVITSPLKLGSFLKNIAPAECGNLFWGAKGKRY